MPEISRFFGIIIRMFPEVGAPRHRPHFHAVYQESKAIFAYRVVPYRLTYYAESMTPHDYRRR